MHGVWQLTREGKIVVAEYGEHCISIFNQKGEKLRSFGSGQDQLNMPEGVAVDDDSNILVAQEKNLHLQLL